MGRRGAIDGVIAIARQGVAQFLRVDGYMFGDAGCCNLQDQRRLPPGFQP